MLIEACVFNGQHRVFHHFGNVFERREVAPLFAEFANLHALGGEDSHGEFGAVVCEVGNVRQLGVNHRQRDAHEQGDGQAQDRQQAKRPKQ